MAGREGGGGLLLRDGGWGLRGWWWRGRVAVPCYWPLGEGSGGLRRVTGRWRWRWKGSGEWRGMWAEDESKILERLASRYLLRYFV